MATNAVLCWCFEFQDVAEGAIATVVRNEANGNAAAMKAEPDPGAVEARPIADFAPAVTSRRVNFLKIDVEGFELHGEYTVAHQTIVSLAVNAGALIF